MSELVLKYVTDPQVVGAIIGGFFAIGAALLGVWLTQRRPNVTIEGADHRDLSFKARDINDIIQAASKISYMIDGATFSLLDVLKKTSIPATWQRPRSADFAQHLEERDLLRISPETRAVLEKHQWSTFATDLYKDKHNPDYKVSSRFTDQVQATCDQVLSDLESLNVVYLRIGKDGNGGDTRSLVSTNLGRAVLKTVLLDGR